MENKSMLAGLSAEEKKQLLKELQNEEKQERVGKRNAYEALRKELLLQVESKLLAVATDVALFKDWLNKECESFKEVMSEYGQLKKSEQRNFTLVNGSFKLEVSSNSVKGFDERANIAAERLVKYLEEYAKKTDKGTADPMYQLAMTLLERNKAGDLDYKSISKLYALEDKFDNEYAEIMTLFKESNVVQKTALNYYFFQLNDKGVWTKIEPSFCRL